MWFDIFFFSHPDKKDADRELFEKVSEAKKVLLDKELREEYEAVFRVDKAAGCFDSPIHNKARVQSHGEEILLEVLGMKVIVSNGVTFDEKFCVLLNLRALLTLLVLLVFVVFLLKPYWQEKRGTEKDAVYVVAKNGNSNFTKPPVIIQTVYETDEWTPVENISVEWLYLRSKNSKNLREGFVPRNHVKLKSH